MVTPCHQIHLKMVHRLGFKSSSLIPAGVSLLEVLLIP